MINLYICTFNRLGLAISAAKSLKKNIINKDYKIILVCGLGDSDKFSNPIFDEIIESSLLNPSTRRMGFIKAYEHSSINKVDLSLCIDDDIRLVSPIDINERYPLSKYVPDNTFCVQVWRDHKEKFYKHLKVVRLTHKKQCYGWDEKLSNLAISNWSERIDDVWLHIDKGSETMTQKRQDLIKYIDGDERMTIKTTEKSEKDDTNDLRGLRHGRAKHEGFPIGQTINPAPMLFTRDGHNLWMADMYKGSSAFLILGGPSFGDLINEKEKIELYPKKFISNKDCLKYPGILTMSVNNTPKTFRTNLWTCVDDPSHFIKSIWLDPVIQKFVPLDHAEKFIFDNETWKTTEIKVGDCPNVVFYRRNEKFQAKQFLTESTFNWGDHSNLGGGRTVMLVAIRMLYYLGIRKIYLLGCDFSMSSESKYHFKQGRSKSSINGNNGTYAKLMKRFSDLKPILKEHNLEIYNCNHESRLRVFPFVNFREAWFDVIKHMPVNIKNERTDGLYDRMAKLKKDNK